MNGSMHSKVLESIVSPKWFIEQKFICSVLPHNFFSPLSIYKWGLQGLKGGTQKHAISLAALLGQEGMVGEKCGI